VTAEAGDQRPDTIEVKQQIRDSIELIRPQLIELSLKIHDNPELGYEEVKAAGWLCQYLEENGFTVAPAICDMPTAFRAGYGQGEPVIAILAEYDALPGVGHGCGHNLIAGSAVGAGIATRIAADRFGGSILVIGTPAEELAGRGGKVVLLERGAFDGVDAALMMHPALADIAGSNSSSALESLKVEFFGKESHAGARPYQGINALEAMITAFNAVNSLRQRLRNQGAVQGIITDGGKAANIIPAYSAGEFMLRAEDNVKLDALKQQFLNCFIGAATASGARFQYQAEGRMEAVLVNMTLARLFAENAASLGRRMRFVKLRSPASTDFGNVSWQMPGISPLLAAAPEGTRGHSPEMAAAAASEMGFQTMLDAAAGMAMTVADLLAQPEILAKAKREFQRQSRKAAAANRQ